MPLKNPFVAGLDKAEEHGQFFEEEQFKARKLDLWDSIKDSMNFVSQHTLVGSLAERALIKGHPDLAGGELLAPEEIKGLYLSLIHISEPTRPY